MSCLGYENHFKGHITDLLTSLNNQCIDKDEMNPYLAICCNICDIAFTVYIILFKLLFKYILIGLFEVFLKWANFEKIVYSI